VPLAPDPKHFDIVEDQLLVKKFSFQFFEPRIAFVRFINNTRGPEALATAKNVRADVIFSYPPGEFELHTNGLWIYDFADLEKDMTGSYYSSDARTIWFKPGERQYIALATRYGKLAYAVNQVSRRHHHFDNPDVALPKGLLSVRLELRADGVDKTWEYELLNTDTAFKLASKP
jgi:hypothetical protein